MGEVSRYPHGTFCWVELGTRDVPAAKPFYRELFGWELHDLPAPGGGTYTVCRLGGRDVAGIHEHAEGERAGWGSAIAVDGVDAATARARELGAAVLVEPSDLPGAARTSLIRDPVGAEVSLWQARGFTGAGLVNEVGTWSWNELVTPEVERAAAFYAALLGWRAEPLPGPFPRTSFTLGDLLVGGAHAPAPQEGEAPRWTVSFRVADVDASAGRAQQLGGGVLLPPMGIPVGRMAIVADPAGAAFTLASFERPFRGVDGS